MNGRLFQLWNHDNEQVGLIWCSDSDFDEDTFGYHWLTFLRDKDDSDVDEFADYVSEKTGEVFERVYSENIYV